MSNLQAFRGQTILLTSAFGGFGRKFTRFLLEAGARLILTDRDCPPLENVFRSEGIDPRLQDQVLACIPLDLGETGCGQKLYEACSAIGPVDRLILNAGIGYGGYYEDIPWDKVDIQLRVMLLAPMEITHAFLPDLLKRKNGHVIFISSVAGFVATPFGTPYSTAKFGLRAFAMALHGESKSRGIDVSIVYPFFTRTNILESEAYGNPPVKAMPEFLLEEPDTIIKAVIGGIAGKKLHIFPGKFSGILWNVNKLFPMIAPQMKAPWR